MNSFSSSTQFSPWWFFGLESRHSSRSPLCGHSLRWRFSLPRTRLYRSLPGQFRSGQTLERPQRGSFNLVETFFDAAVDGS